MSECNCGCSSNLLIIKQGDAYAVQVSLKFNGEPIVYSDLDLIEEIEFTFGELAPMRFKPKDIYNTTIGAFLVPLTQEQTFMLEDGKILVDCRVQFWGGDVVGVSRMVRVFVREALSWEILPEKPYHKLTPPAPGDVLVLPLTVTANGTYTAPSGSAYSPIVVNVPQGSGDGLVSDKTYSFNNPAIQAFVNDVTYTTDYSSSSVDPYTRRSDANLGRPNGVDAVLSAGTLRQSNVGMVNEESVNAGTKTLYNYQPQKTGSYAVVADGGVSNFGNVVASGNVRVIYGETLKNMRDIGGWACDGGTVRYGLLYRSSELTGSSGGAQMSTADKNMLQNLLGIRAELDMRDVSEDGGTGSFDSIVSYLHQTIGNYADAFSSNNIGKFKIAAEFLMNNAIQGKSTVYHCVAGADRTGTITWVLLGVLGVTQSDCDKEYEITNFSGPARLRSGNLAGLYTYVNGLDGENFTQKCLQALLNCGISIDLINHFRHAMIDGNPVDLEPNVIIEPITVVVDNLKASTRMSYSPAQTATSVADIVGNDNGGLALAVTTPNDWSFMDRENNTVYLMPIPEGCNKVAISTTDTSIAQYKFSALKAQNGTVTRVTNSGYVNTNVHQWATGSANFICISCIYSVDGTIKPAWSYDPSQITVTFTNY